MTDLEEQLVRAYADERFRLPQTALTGLVRRRRRRLGLVTVAAGVVLVTAGVGIAFGRPEATPELPGGGSPAPSAEAAACYEHAGGGASPPDVAFTLVAPDDPDDRLVVVAGNQLAAACTRADTIRLSPANPGSGQLWPDGDQLEFAYTSNAAHGLVVIGTTPAATERVEVVVLPDGTTLPAARVQLRDGWFAAWLPAPAYDPGRHHGLRVVAHTATDIEEVETVIE